MTNLLPYDGEVYYYGSVLAEQDADKYFDLLMTELAWQHDELMMFGRQIITKREVAWYGDEGLSYRYSGQTKHPHPWTAGLLELKTIAEEHCAEGFNSCLANLYHSGEEGMSWHSDDERELKRHGAIASLSLGADRRFSFRHKVTKEKVDVQLKHGSLLIMTGVTQDHWKHQLPKSRKVTDPRINLTFRTIVK